MKRKIYCFTLAMLMLFSSLLVHFINEPIVHAFDSTGWTAGSEGWFESDVMNQDNVAADGSLIFTFSNFPTNDREYHYHYAATAASVAIQICVDGIWHDTYKDANGEIKPLTGGVDANGEPDFIKDQQLEDSSTIITIGLNKDSAGWIWEDNNQPGRNGWAHIPGEQHTYQIRFYAKQWYQAHEYHQENAPTCYNYGLQKCNFCKHSYAIAPLGHNLSYRSITWGSDNKSFVMTYKCKRDEPDGGCGNELHTISSDGTVSTMTGGKYESFPPGFNIMDYIHLSETTKPATCSDKGSITYTATIDSFDGCRSDSMRGSSFDHWNGHTETKTVPISAKGHDYQYDHCDWEKSGNAYTGCVFTYKCSDCPATTTKRATVTSTVTSDATCTKNGVTKYTATYNAWINDRGNTVPAKTVTESLSNISATGHDLRWVVDTALTCTQDYTGHLHCVNPAHKNEDGLKDGLLNETVSDPNKSPLVAGTKVILKAPGHHFEELVNDKEATCTESGASHYVCTNTINGVKCTETNSKKGNFNTADHGTFVVNSTGHRISKDSITKKPTVYSNGIRVYTCEYCNQEITNREIEKRKFNVYIGDKRVVKVYEGDKLVWNGSYGEQGTDGKAETDHVKTMIENNWYYKDQQYKN